MSAPSKRQVHFMRFIVEDYRLDLKDIYYMTPLITIAKNFISQIIVISLADKEWCRSIW
jgi:hypothetical protein